MAQHKACRQCLFKMFPAGSTHNRCPQKVAPQTQFHRCGPLIRGKHDSSDAIQPWSWSGLQSSAMRCASSARPAPSACLHAHPPTTASWVPAASAVAGRGGRDTHAHSLPPRLPCSAGGRGRQGWGRGRGRDATWPGQRWSWVEAAATRTAVHARLAALHTTQATAHHRTAQQRRVSWRQ